MRRNDKQHVAEKESFTVHMDNSQEQLSEALQLLLAIEKITEGIRIYREAGIEVLGQFLIGNMGETHE